PRTSGSSASTDSSARPSRVWCASQPRYTRWPVCSRAPVVSSWPRRLREASPGPRSAVPALSASADGVQLPVPAAEINRVTLDYGCREHCSDAQHALVRDDQLVIEGITLRGAIVRRAVGVRIQRRILFRVLGLERPRQALRSEVDRQ